MEEQASQPASEQDPRIGAVLQERYRILRKLGDGGMGAVYEGEHILIKRRVAIKVLHSQFAKNPEIVARFRREAEAATSIGHPNIVEVTDMGTFPDGTTYMVLEFLAGRDWSEDIESQGPQPLGKVVHIMSQVCDALEAAHGKGIVHRDLKPENIYLIERRGDPNFAKVLDFGISKIANTGGENRSLTQTGAALGTPYYMAPEQCQGRKDIDARADIYSLGVILFQALTGQYPFDDESYPMLVLKICTEPPPPLAHYRPDLPPEIQQIANCMLAKDPAQRYPRCADVKAALAPFRDVNDEPVVAQDAPKTSARGPSVLQSSPGGPAMTPTGTAYLPDGAQTGPAPGATPYPGSKKGSGLVIALVAAVGLLVVVGGVAGVIGFMSFGSGDDAADPPSTVAAPPAVPAPPAVEPAAADDHGTEAASDAPAEEGDEPSPAADMVHVVITATPANATLTLDDGQEILPFEADIARGVHHVVVAADGYETYDQRPNFRHPNQRLPIELQPEGRARRGRRHRHRNDVIAVSETSGNAQPSEPSGSAAGGSHRGSGHDREEQAIFGSGGGSKAPASQHEQSGGGGIFGGNSVFGN